MNKVICDEKNNCHAAECFHRFPHNATGDCTEYSCINSNGKKSCCIPVVEEKPKSNWEKTNESFQSMCDLILTLKENIALKDEFIKILQNQVEDKNDWIIKLEKMVGDADRTIDKMVPRNIF